MGSWEHPETKTVRIHKRRRLKVTQLIKFIGLLGLIILSLNCLWLLIDSLLTKPVIAKWETIEKGMWTEALFLRDESVLIAPCSGFLVMEEQPGQRVPAHDLLSRIYSDENDISLEKNNFQSPSDQKAQKLWRKEYLLNCRLDWINDQLKKQSGWENLLIGQKSPRDFNDLKQEKAGILRSIQEIHSWLKIINNQAESIRGQRAIIFANQPGYFVNQYDRWETKLSIGNINFLKTEDLRRRYILKSPGRHVVAGEICGKIISPFKQVIFIEINPKETGIPKKGDGWWLKTDTKLEKLEVIKVIHVNKDHILLGLEDPLFAADQLPERRSRIYLIYRRVSGVTVPAGALLKKGKSFLLKVVRGDGYQLKQVRVIENDGSKAIIEGIEFGTTILSR